MFFFLKKKCETQSFFWRIPYQLYTCPQGGCKEGRGENGLPAMGPPNCIQYRLKTHTPRAHLSHILQFAVFLKCRRLASESRKISGIPPSVSPLLKKAWCCCVRLCCEAGKTRSCNKETLVSTARNDGWKWRSPPHFKNVVFFFLPLFHFAGICVAVMQYVTRNSGSPCPDQLCHLFKERTVTDKRELPQIKKESLFRLSS